MTQDATQPAGSMWGGALLIAGTCIGGGMLALPVLTSQGGLVPALVLYLGCWALMASTGLLFLEVCCWTKGEVNIVTMAERTLGVAGKLLAWVIYLFLFYTLTLAYISGSGNLFTDLAGEHVPDWVGTAMLLGLFSPLVYIGPTAVDRVNRVFMLGLGLSFTMFLVLGFPHVELSRMNHSDWGLIWIALPVAFASFAYQGTIPTVYYYLGQDTVRCRRAILLGSLLPFICYAIWEVLINGILPTYGPGGMVEALRNEENAVRPLGRFLTDPTVVRVGVFFGFFAMVTSFLGVTLGLRDFLSDALSVKKDARGRLLLCVLVFAPPALISFTYPHLFLSSLSIAGGFGCAILLGVLPVLMVWRLRYRMGAIEHMQLGGGRFVLLLLLVALLFEVAIEAIKLAQYT